MKEPSKPNQNGQAEQELEKLLSEWRRTLPKEFKLGTVGNGGSKHRRYPDLHFTADEKIPGLYYADLDPQSLGFNDNGHADGMEFREPERKKDK